MRGKVYLYPAKLFIATIGISMNWDFFLFLRGAGNKLEPVHIWQDVVLFFVLALISILCITIKHIVTSEPIAEDSDLHMLSFEKILLSVLLFPIVEEFSFRGFLVFDDRRCIYASFILTLFLVYVVVKSPSFMCFLLAMITLFFLFLLFNNGFRSSVVLFIARNKIAAIYISSIIFGVLHIANYERFSVVDSIFIFHKILSGLFFSYAIVKYNNIWPACLFHAMNNAIPTLILYFFRMCIR